jgi:hypothetical protein
MTMAPVSRADVLCIRAEEAGPVPDGVQATAVRSGTPVVPDCARLRLRDDAHVAPGDLPAAIL